MDQVDKLRKNQRFRDSAGDSRNGHPLRPVPRELAAVQEAGLYNPNLHEGYIIHRGKRTIYAHRKVIEKLWGRPLTSDELVHHWNESRTDNDPENLVVMSRSNHQKLHMFLRQRAQVCKRGHPFENNVYVSGGSKKCRICHLERSRRDYYAKKNAKAQERVHA